MNHPSEPTWEIAHLFPAQGTWSVEEYLALDTNQLVEFSDGHIEVLSMPSLSHQRIIAHLYHLLLLFIQTHSLGEVIFAPLRIELWPGKFREPDLIFMLAEHKHRKGEQYWQGADLVVEVISPDDPKRDTEIKRREYAQAGIPEYWLVDPRDRSITVLTLVGNEYAEHGRFSDSEQAMSKLLVGFTAEVTAVFDAASD